MQTSGIFFDGQTSKDRKVQVDIEPGHIEISLSEESESDASYPRKYESHNYVVTPRLGNLHRSIEFSDGARLELNAAPDLDRVIYPKNKLSLVHYLENHSPSVAALTVATVLIILATYFWVIPHFAASIAAIVPINTDIAIGNKIEKYLNAYPDPQMEVYDSPVMSGLTVYELVDLLNRHTWPKTQLPLQFSIVELGIGPNALALPNGRILITADLINLLPSRDHLYAILYHEIGHIAYRHSLNMILQSSAATLLLFTLSGYADVSTIPTLVLNSGYSREFEREADQFAVKALLAQKKSPKLLSEALTLLENNPFHSTGGDHHMKLPKLLSSHPDTKERIELIEKADRESHAAPMPQAPLSE